MRSKFWRLQTSQESATLELNMGETYVGAQVSVPRTQSPYIELGENHVEWIRDALTACLEEERTWVVFIDVEKNHLTLKDDGDKVLLEVSNPGDPRQYADIYLEKHHVKMLRNELSRWLEKEREHAG